jgi:hypothetical protein
VTTIADVDLFLASGPWKLRRVYRHRMADYLGFAEFEVTLTTEQLADLRWVFMHLSGVRSQLTDMPGEVTVCRLDEITLWQGAVRTNQIADVVTSGRFLARRERCDKFLNERPLVVQFAGFAVILDGHHRAIAETIATGTFTGRKVDATDLLEFMRWLDSPARPIDGIGPLERLLR